jgi:hypothetical protein
MFGPEPDRQTILRDYPCFEKLIIFKYFGQDSCHKALELAELFAQNNIDFCAYGALNPDSYDVGFVVRKSGYKWKEIIAMANGIKPMHQLIGCKYYYKTIRFALTEPGVKFSIGNLKECLWSMYY